MRQCEAMILMDSGVYTACGKTPVERHHRLTRARGGTILDKAGETYHLMDLCPTHHRMADGGDARLGGLLIDGYVTTCTQCGLPEYVGPDTYLTERFGQVVHMQSLWGCEGGALPSEGLREEARE